MFTLTLKTGQTITTNNPKEVYWFWCTKGASITPPARKKVASQSAR